MLRSIRFAGVLGAALLSVVPNTARSATSVFGLELGSPVSFEQCEKAGNWFLSPKAGACVEDRKASALSDGRLTGSTTIRFAPDQLPIYVKSFSVRGKFSAGVLVGVEFWTLGPAFDSEVLAQLIGKFGAPSKSIANKVKTRAGVEFDAPLHLWQLGAVSVSYAPISGSIDQGRVSVDTPGAAAVDALERDASDPALKGARPL